MNDVNPQDPKWTAYLLGELSPEETRQVEQELESNPEAKAYMDGLAGTQDALRGYFAQEQELELDPEQKGEVTVAVSNRKRPVPLAVWALPIAATLMIALALPLLQPERPVWKEVEEHPLQTALEEKEQVEAIEVSRTPVGAPEEVKDSDLVLDQEPMRRQMVAPTASQPVPETESVPELCSEFTTFVVLDGLSLERSQRARGATADAFGNVPVQEETLPPSMISPSQDEFDVLEANPFRRVVDHPLSTFSIDVDTASYSVVRKMLKAGRLPPKDAVRIEEMVNYFDYDYAPPTDGSPFAAHMQVAPAPWAPEHRLVRVALKGKEIAAEERPALNLVYLLDVSGSMSGGNRLPLVKRAMKTLAGQLDERDRVAIVVYAGAAGLVLPSTSGENEQAIVEALDRLTAGGSTAGGAGIQLAYETARAQFVEGGVNRVILCTDGDFNVGLNQTGDLQTLIEKEAESGVQLTVLGFGMGNYKDDTLETLSNKGNGNYAYIDDYSEARKVLVDDLLGNMITIAKDVKIQVEFNPAYVGAYRLIGYENRMLKKEDFNNDRVDAGEIGAGHTVTAFYELIPPGKPVPGEAPDVDDLKYQTAAVSERTDAMDTELLTLKLRHKQPDGDTSVKTEFVLPAIQRTLAESDSDFRFTSAVAGFGLWLRDPDFRKRMTIEDLLNLAQSGRGQDEFGYRAEFLQLMRTAKSLE